MSKVEQPRFDLEVAEKRVRETFVPEFLTQPHNRDYWPATVLNKYRCAITDALMEYSRYQHNQPAWPDTFKFVEQERRTEKDTTDLFYVTDEFQASGYQDFHPMILKREQNLICDYVNNGLKTFANRSPKLRNMITKTSIDSTEDVNGGPEARISINAKIEPVPDNFRKYLSVADLYAYAHRWLRSSTAARIKKLEEEFEEMVGSSKPRY